MKKVYLRPEAEYIEFYSEETITTYEGSNVGVGSYDTENGDFWGAGAE